MNRNEIRDVYCILYTVVYARILLFLYYDAKSTFSDFKVFALLMMTLRLRQMTSVAFCNLFYETHFEDKLSSERKWKVTERETPPFFFIFLQRTGV